MEILKYIIILILSTFGMVSIIKSSILLLCRDSKKRCILIIPIDDSCKNPESVIRSSVLYYEWCDRKIHSEIYCVYNGSNAESIDICKRVCDEYPFVHFHS